MAFNLQSWGRQTQNANNKVTTLQDGTFVGAPSVYTYISATDTQATIATANYFAAVVVELNVGDIIFAIDNTNVPIEYVVTAVNVSAQTVTIANAAMAGGDVIGTPPSTLNALARYSDATGLRIKNSVIVVTDAGDVTGVNTLTANNAVIVSNGGDVAFFNPANTFFTTIVEGASLANKGYIWPLTMPTANGQFLTSTTLGQWSWSTGVAMARINATSNQTMVNNAEYTCNRVAGNTGFLLPAASAVGDVISIVGNLNGWTVAQNAGQSIQFDGVNTTVGVGGSLASTVATDCISFVCVVANTTYTVKTSVGNITVT